MEKTLINFWMKNQPKIFLLIILLIVFPMIWRLPYLNVILTPSVVGTILWLTLLLLFGFGSKASFIAIAVVLILTGLAQIFQKPEWGSETAIFVYYLVIVAFIQILFEVKNEKRKDR